MLSSTLPFATNASLGEFDLSFLSKGLARIHHNASGRCMWMTSKIHSATYNYAGTSSFFSPPTFLRMRHSPFGTGISVSRFGLEIGILAFPAAADGFDGTQTWQHLILAPLSMESSPC